MKKRSFQSISFEKNLSLGIDESVYDAFDIQTDEEGNIYILDAGTQQVKKFSPDGDLLTTYGKGDGEGPEEFEGVEDLQVLRNGTILVADSRGRKVAVFDSDGALLHSNQLETIPRQVVAGQKGNFIVESPSNTRNLFSVYTYQGTQIDAFGHLVENQSVRGTVLFGKLAQIPPRNGFVYLGFKHGYLASYALDGTLNYYVETIDPSGMSRYVKTDKAQALKIERSKNTPEGLPIYAPLLHVHGDTVYTSVVYQKTERQVIDAYRLSNGAYLFSMSPPKADRCGVYVVTDEHIYSECDQKTVVQFSYTHNDAE